MAARILSLIDEPARANQMGRLARTVVEDKYSARAMVRSMVRMYDQLLEPHR
jgi:hypothetical protein